MLCEKSGVGEQVTRFERITLVLQVRGVGEMVKSTKSRNGEQ